MKHRPCDDRQAHSIAAFTRLSLLSSDRGNWWGSSSSARVFLDDCLGGRGGRYAKPMPAQIAGGPILILNAARPTRLQERFRSGYLVLHPGGRSSADGATSDGVGTAEET